MSAKDTLGNAPGLKEHEAKQNRVAHSSPNRPNGIAACCDALNEHRVNCNTYKNQQPLKAHGKQGLDVVLSGAAKLPVGKRSNGDGGQTGQQIDFQHSAIYQNENDNSHRLHREANERRLQPQPQKWPQVHRLQRGFQFGKHIRRNIGRALNEPACLRDNALRHIEHTSILNSDVSLDLERILQENVLLEEEGSEDADTADSDAADSESATASLAKEITGKKIRPASKLQESCTLDGISRDFTDLTVNPSSPAAIQLDTATSRLYQRVYLIFALTADSDGTLTVSQNSDMVYQIPFTAGEKKNVQIAISISSDSVNFSCEKKSCRITDLALLGSVKTISAYTGAQIAFDENTEKDQISGTVTTENAGFLFLPIPYSKNVKAYVDGIKTDVLRADACFVCVPVGSGEHTFAFYRK